MRRVATIAATAVLLTACGNPHGYSLAEAPPKAADPPPTLSSTAATFTITGQVEVRAESPGRPGSNPCLPDNLAYDDLKTSAAAVTVLDPGGQAIALGRLGEGVYLDASKSRTARCGFAFEVSRVPEGEPFYLVKVGSRVPVRYTRGELNRKLSVTLGDF